jgi:hypothetical protein
MQQDASDFQMQADQSPLYHSLVLLMVGIGVPILFTVVQYLPFVHGLVEKLRPYIVYAPLFGSYNMRRHPWIPGSIPTVGQSLYIALMFALTIALCGPGYFIQGVPNDLGPSVYWDVMSFVVGRTGCFGYAILPLVVLFAGRNNLLLWVTNWSHSTYMIMHRWISRLWALLAIVHSILALALYVKYGIYAKTVKQAWWAWGILATVTTTVLVCFSFKAIRRWSYNAFLLFHILMAVMTIVGCWYHAWLSPYGYAPITILKL